MLVLVADSQATCDVQPDDDRLAKPVLSFSISRTMTEAHKNNRSLTLEAGS